MDRTDTFYSADEAISGYGAQLLMGDGASPEAFQAVAFMENIQFGDMVTEGVDVTHLRSPDAHREMRPGLRSSGAFSGALSAYVPTDESHSYQGGGTGAFAAGGLSYVWTQRLVKNWLIRVGPDGGSPAIELPFNGYISKFQPGNFEAGTIVKGAIEIQPSRSFSAGLP